MKKGSRKIILGLLAFFLLLVGMYVYHMNTLREGNFVSQAGSLIGATSRMTNVHEGSVTISGRDALNQMWDAMFQLEPEFNLVDWLGINFSEQTTLENWGRGGEYQIYDQDGNVMAQYSERLNPTTSQTESPPAQTQPPSTGQGADDNREFMSSDRVLRDAQNEYYSVTKKVVTRRGMDRINELRELYPEMPVDLLFYIQGIEENNGWTPFEQSNLDGFMETINLLGREEGTKVVRDWLETKIGESKPSETNVLNTNETKTGVETSVEFEWNKEMETGPVSINEEPGLILGD